MHQADFPFRLLDFPVRGDARGSLVALEALSDAVPFEIKRMYYIFATRAGVTRGKHAHHRLKQVLVAVSGSCDICLDNGQARQTIHLDNPAKGLYLEGFLWREMSNFSPDCVLAVLASDHYDEKDYVRNYDEFLRLCRQKQL